MTASDADHADANAQRLDRDISNHEGSNDMLLERPYKTLFYRYAEAPALLTFGIGLLAVVSPRPVSVTAIVLGFLLIVGETVVYLVRFRSLPPSASWHPPSAKHLTGRMRLRLGTAGWSVCVVMFRVAGVMAFFSWS